SVTGEAGTATLVSNTERMAVNGAFLANCRRYKFTWLGGGIEDWYLAPDVGFVQIGQADAFTLSSFQVNNTLPLSTAGVRAAECPAIGIDPNPAAYGDYSDPGLKTELDRTFESGSRYLSISATWTELEPSPGVFALDRIRKIAAWASQKGMTASLTLRAVDTNGPLFPDDLKGKAMDDALVLRRLSDLLTAITPVMPAVRYFHLANEADIYLQNHQDQIPAFRTFFAVGQSELRRGRPGASTGIVYAFHNVRLNSLVFDRTKDLGDHVGYTYYPLGVGLMQRNPSAASADLTDLVRSSNGRQILITELGFSSSREVNGSPELQGQFYENTFRALAQNSGTVVAANFFLKSDIHPVVLSSLVSSYGLWAGSPFSNFLSGLGTVDLNGGPKPAWYAFQSGAGRFLQPTACRR
ncbi:MAG: hypothetical protein H7039_22900, partial [Bryobacteraceae bacterium]|nr:hypothetical protein [Bryobacteraceae bacterium]